MPLVGTPRNVVDSEGFFLHKGESVGPKKGTDMSQQDGANIVFALYKQFESTEFYSVVVVPSIAIENSRSVGMDVKGAGKIAICNLRCMGGEGELPHKYLSKR